MAKALTVKRLERLLKVPGKYTDGGKEGVKGLMLTVAGPGSAAWSLRWQRDHKVRQTWARPSRAGPAISRWRRRGTRRGSSIGA